MDNKFCVDCVHYELYYDFNINGTENGKIHNCLRTKREILNLVTGNNEAYYNSCEEERKMEFNQLKSSDDPFVFTITNACGKEGRFYEKKS